MPMTVLVAVDGSDVSMEAARRGLELLGRPDDAVLLTVIDAGDAMMVTGTGMAGGTMSQAEFETHETTRRDEAHQMLREAAASLGVTADVLVLQGDAGREICRAAEDVSSRAIVVGSRGRGGVARALLGSVSDHVVRNAPCPVVITS